MDRKPFNMNALSPHCDMWFLWNQTRCKYMSYLIPISHPPPSQVLDKVITLHHCDLRYAIGTWTQSHIIYDLFLCHVWPLSHSFAMGLPPLNCNCDKWWTWTQYHYPPEFILFSSPPYHALQRISLLNRFYDFNEELT